MGRQRARSLLSAYRRRLLRVARLGCAGQTGLALLPVTPVWPLVERPTVGFGAGGGSALVLAFNSEERLPFMSLALQHYFSAVARVWVGDPLGRVLRGPAYVPPLCADAGDLVRGPSEDTVSVTHLSLAGQWLPLVQAAGWQPGTLVEDAREVLSFWSARSRMTGQARVSQVLAGYYLRVLEARFRCRVGVHVSCGPALRRGDAAFVRGVMARWHWSSCWGGPRDLMAGALLSLILSLRACDARGVARAVRFLLVCAGYFRHRALLVFLQRFVAAALDFVGLSSDVRGVLLQLRGKIGRRGLARKSKYVISCGVPRPREGCPRILWDYTQASTITGVLGLNVALVF